jgi:molecular chaperone GrpE
MATQQDDTPPATEEEYAIDLEVLLKELEQMKELAARSQADLQNAKSRMEKEVADGRKYAVERLLLRLLPTVDNFQRAFVHLPEDLKDHEWVKGLQVIEQDFLKEMEAVGLKRMESLGRPVDATQHDVLQAGAGEEGIVCEVFEEGYVLHERVLKPAKVMVGNGEISDKT